MARFERRSVLESIQNPFSEYARAEEERARGLETIRRSATTAYEYQRRNEAKKEAGEIVYKPGDKVQLQSEMTSAGRAFNEASVAGYVASVKNQYSSELDRMYLENKDDPEKFQNSSQAYLKGLLNEIPADMRSAISTDFNVSARSYANSARANARTNTLNEARANINAANARIVADAYKSAFDGEQDAAHYHEWTHYNSVIKPLQDQGEFIEAEKQQRKFAEGMENQMIFGQMQRNLDVSADQGGSFIETFKKSDHGLDPERLETVLTKMRTMHNQKLHDENLVDKTGRALFNKQFPDFIKSLEAGVEPDEATSEFFSDEKIDRFATSPAEARLLKEQRADAIDFNKTLNLVKTADQDDLVKMILDQKPDSTDVPNFAREQRQYEMLLKAKKVRDDALSSDPAAYVIATSDTLAQSWAGMQEDFLKGQAKPEDIQNYIEAQREAQKGFGVPDNSVQLIPKQLETVIAASLNDMTNGGENSVMMLNNMKAMLGSDFKTVVRQLSNNKSIGISAKVIASVDNPMAQKYVAQAINQPKTAYKDILDPDTYKDINDNSADITSDLQQTLRRGYGNAGDQSYTVYKQAIELTAMKLVADGSETSYGGALESAKDMIFGDVEFIDSYRVPKQVNGVPVNMNEVQNGASAITQKIATGAIGIKAPPSAVVINQEDANEVYRKALVATPITSLDGTGIVFIDQHNDIIQDKDGKDLFFKWSEVEGYGYEYMTEEY